MKAKTKNAGRNKDILKTAKTKAVKTVAALGTAIAISCAPAAEDILRCEPTDVSAVTIAIYGDRVKAEDCVGALADAFEAERAGAPEEVGAAQIVTALEGVQATQITDSPSFLEAVEAARRGQRGYALDALSEVPGMAAVIDDANCSCQDIL